MEFYFFCLFIIIFGLIETRFDPDGAWPGLASSWSGEEEVDHLGDLTVYRSVPEWISAISTLFLSLSHADLAPAWMTSGCSGATTSTALTPGEPRNTATKCGQVRAKFMHFVHLSCQIWEWPALFLTSSGARADLSLLPRGMTPCCKIWGGQHLLRL